MIRFIAVESSLIGCLAILATISFLETAGLPMSADARDGDVVCCQGLLQLELEIIVLGVLTVCGGAVALYWLFQRFGTTRWTFWLFTLISIGFQAPAILSHNSIDWLPAQSIPWLTTGLGASTVTVMLLASLTLLVTLHRVADLRRLYAKLGDLRVDPDERRVVIVKELTVLGGLCGFSLAVSVALLAGGLALAELDSVLGRSPWTVLTMGFAALCLLGSFLYLWLRRHGSF